MTQRCADLDLGVIPPGWQASGLVVWIAPPPAENVNVSFAFEVRGSRTDAQIFTEGRDAIRKLKFPELKISKDEETTFAGMKAHRMEMTHKVDPRGRALLRHHIIAVSESKVYNITATAPEMQDGRYREELEKLLAQVQLAV